MGYEDEHLAVFQRRLEELQQRYTFGEAAMRLALVERLACDRASAGWLACDKDSAILIYVPEAEGFGLVSIYVPET